MSFCPPPRKYRPVRSVPLAFSRYSTVAVLSLL